MKQSGITRLRLHPKILFRFTAHRVTVWAGVISLRLSWAMAWISSTINVSAL